MQPPRFALLLPPLRPRHAATNVALWRCRHRRSLPAAATALPLLRCALPPRFALLLLPLRLRQAAADVKLSRCCWGTYETGRCQTNCKG